MAADGALNETRSTLEKWVETRQVIAKSRSDWQADQELLTQTVQLLERELKSVETQLGQVGSTGSQVEKERAQAEATLKTSVEALEKSRLFAVDFEAQIRSRLPRLPGPLQELLKPLLNRLPAPGAPTKMPATERMQVIVGILGELDKFNNSVSIFNEKQKNQKGEEVAVQTVYVGLGAAYFVNDSGDLAGTGTAGAAGWEWTLRPELAPAIQEVIRIYRNEHPARFISLPALIR